MGLGACEACGKHQPAAGGGVAALAAGGEEPCLLGPEQFLWPVEVSMGPSAGHLLALLAEQGLPLSSLLGRRFPAGSMFACNHAALERLLGLIVPG